jgi:uncharacterized protein
VRQRSFLVLGRRDLPWAYVGAVLAGGVVAAPIAAWAVRKLNPRLLGIAIGSALVLMNLRTVLNAVDLAQPTERVALLSLVAGWTALLALASKRFRREKAAKTGS